MGKFIEEYLNGQSIEYKKHERQSIFEAIEPLKNIQSNLIKQKNVKKHHFMLILGDNNCEESQKGLNDYF